MPARTPSAALPALVTPAARPTRAPRAARVGLVARVGATARAGVAPRAARVGLAARVGAIGLVAIVSLGACADEADGPPGDESGTSTTADDGDGGFLDGDEPVGTVELGAGLAADLPEATEVRQFAPAADEADASGCTSLEGAVSTDDAYVELWLNSTGCAGGRTPDPGNGYHGYYVSIDDVPDPADIAQHPSSAGDLVTFTQAYFECTNECNDYEDNVALLALDAPPDPDRPAVMIVSPRGEVAIDDLVALADAIHPE